MRRKECLRDGRGIGVTLCCVKMRMIRYCNKRLCYLGNRLDWLEVIATSKVLFLSWKRVMLDKVSRG